jgi:hypothetical protein
MLMTTQRSIGRCHGRTKINVGAAFDLVSEMGVLE